MAYGVHPLLALKNQGLWQRVVNALAGQTEIEHVLIDSTIVSSIFAVSPLDMTSSPTAISCLHRLPAHLGRS